MSNETKGKLNEAVKATLELEDAIGGMVVDFHKVLVKASDICVDDNKGYLDIREYLEEKREEVEGTPFFRKYGKTERVG